MNRSAKKPATSRRPVGLVRLLLLVLAMGAPVLAGLFAVWVNQESIQIGYQLSAQMERRQKLEATIKKLEVELAAERSPERLEAMARKLGLVPAKPGQVYGGAQ